MKRWILVPIVALVLLATGCGEQGKDLKDVTSKEPDKIELYVNVDQHPNIVRLCIDGVAFATTTRNYGDALLRVPEWDTWCKE